MAASDEQELIMKIKLRLISVHLTACNLDSRHLIKLFIEPNENSRDHVMEKMYWWFFLLAASLCSRFYASNIGYYEGRTESHEQQFFVK